METFIARFLNLHLLNFLLQKTYQSFMKHISVQELKQRLDAGEALHIIDCREQDEYDIDNLGVKLLPLSQLSMMDADDIEDWKEEEVIVHCRSGKRSMQACLLLETMGFQKTTNVDGGILAWREHFGEQKIG